VATGSPSDVADLVLALAASRPATLPGGRLVCVDGPAGSGKTTLSAALADATGAQVIHADDLMEGWDGLDAVERQLLTVLADLTSSRPASYRRFDWLHDRYAERPVEVPPAPWLVVEGVGSGAAALTPYVTGLVWVEADDDLRLARGLERDGSAMEERWRRFMEDEAVIFSRERTRERADVLVDGTGATAPVVRARPRP
jgi:uridine kinase